MLVWVNALRPRPGIARIVVVEHPEYAETEVAGTDGRAGKQKGKRRERKRKRKRKRKMKRERRAGKDERGKDGGGCVGVYGRVRVTL